MTDTDPCPRCNSVVLLPAGEKPAYHGECAGCGRRWPVNLSALVARLAEAERTRDQARRRLDEVRGERDALRACDQKVWPDMLDKATARAEKAEAERDALAERLARAEAERDALRFDKDDLRATMELLAKPPTLPASTLSGAVAYLLARRDESAAAEASARENGRREGARAMLRRLSGPVEAAFADALVASALAAPRGDGR